MMKSTSQLNVKTPEARRLADELCSLTGETVSRAVTVALRERLEREQKIRSRKGLAERLMEIGKQAASLPVLDPRAPDELLYDELGLPR
jgi:antitoxin VapB